MVKTDIQDKFLMPEFTLDSTYDSDNKETPGVKRMYDIALAINDSVMQWGGPGIGKSQSVKQWNADKVREYEKRIAKGENVKPWNPTVCDVRLSMKEPVDMIGIPMPFTNEKGETQTMWAVPNMWPKDNGEFSGGVIHLDEMNQGQAAILNAAFQLIQDRALGDYKVPEGYLIIGSANTSAYNNTVTEFSIPLANRFTHFNIVPDFNSWIDYSLNSGGNLDVMTFLKTQGQDMLFDREGMKKKVGNLSDAMFTDVSVTPRSWEVVGKVLALPEGTKQSGGFSMLEKQMYCTGRLGLSLASKFFTWLKDKSKYQDWHEILEQGKDFRDENSLEQFWAVQMACMATISNTTDSKLCRKYCLNFVNATKNLQKVSNKVINITQLSRLKRLEGELKTFNPVMDAPELVKLITMSLKN
jgi:hypothetical protein